MQPKFPERAIDDELKSRAHEPATRVWLEGVVPEVAALEAAPHDFIDVDDTDECTGEIIDDEISLVAGLPDVAEPCVVGTPVPGWICEVPMKAPTSSQRAKELLSPVRGRSFEVHAPRHCDLPGATNRTARQMAKAVSG